MLNCCTINLHVFRLLHIPLTAVKGITLKGKIGAAFGSFGWSGEAPKLLMEIMKNKFEMNVITPPLLSKYAPDQTMLTKCHEFGKNISEKGVKTAKSENTDKRYELYENPTKIFLHTFIDITLNFISHFCSPFTRRKP